MKRLHPLTAALVAALAGFQAPAGSTATPTSSEFSAPASTLADGEVRKVDHQAGKLTLRHGPLESLDMPPMTMVFRVADAKMLEGLKPGDRLRFRANRVRGALTVTHIETVR